MLHQTDYHMCICFSHTRKYGFHFKFQNSFSMEFLYNFINTWGNTQKATELVHELKKLLYTSSNPEKLLAIICSVLKDQGETKLNQIVDEMTLQVCSCIYT